MPRKRLDPVAVKIAQYWPDRDRGEIVEILNGYGAGKSAWGRRRVHLAILKVSEGRLERLRGLVEAANRDYRDVVAWAENPEQSKMRWVEWRELSEARKNRIRRRDKRRYQRWLRRRSRPVE
jgi:hypothetical protein